LNNQLQNFGRLKKELLFLSFAALGIAFEDPNLENENNEANYFN